MFNLKNLLFMETKKFNWKKLLMGIIGLILSAGCAYFGIDCYITKQENKQIVNNNKNEATATAISNFNVLKDDIETMAGTNPNEMTVAEKKWYELAKHLQKELQDVYKKIENADTSNTTELQKLIEDLQAKNDEIKREKEKAYKEIKEDNDKKLKEKDKKHAEELEGKNQKIKKQAEEHKEEKARIKSDLIAQFTAYKDSVNNATGEMKKYYESKMDSLQNIIDSLRNNPSEQPSERLEIISTNCYPIYYDKNNNPIIANNIAGKYQLYSGNIFNLKKIETIGLFIKAKGTPQTLTVKVKYPYEEKFNLDNPPSRSGNFEIRLTIEELDGKALIIKYFKDYPGIRSMNIIKGEYSITIEGTGTPIEKSFVID
jgi:hypothetical protein